MLLRHEFRHPQNQGRDVVMLPRQPDEPVHGRQNAFQRFFSRAAAECLRHRQHSFFAVLALRMARLPPGRR